MAGFSRVVMVGNLVRNIESKTYESKSGPMEIANFTLAINDKSMGKDASAFIEVTLFGKQAEVAKQYLSKGSQVMVEGRLNQQNWEDKKTGEKRSKISVNGDRMVLLGASKNSNNSNEGYAQNKRTQVADEIPF